MKHLVHVNTLYQLFVVINMKIENMLKGSVDLVLSDHTPCLIGYKENIKKIGLFNKITYLESLNFNNKFWSIENENKPMFFKNSIPYLQKVCGFNEIEYQRYDMIYFANLDAYSKTIHYNFPKVPISQFEDGTSICCVDWKNISKKWNYIPDFNSIYDDLDKIYLYSPELLNYSINANLIQLPVVQKVSDTIRIYNDIFQYKMEDIPQYIFIEQSFLIDKVINNDIDFIKKTSEIVGYDNLVVKPHPRNLINRSFEYGIARTNYSKIPFEVILLNIDLSKVVLITVNSGSVISPFVMFEERPKVILLFEAISGSTHPQGNESFANHMRIFCEKYKNSTLYIPNSFNEFGCILNEINIESELNY